MRSKEVGLYLGHANRPVRGGIRTTLLCYLLLMTLGCAWGQVVQILTLEREGTAGVYLSENDKIACIIDGGRKGGLTRPRLDNKPVLEALVARGYETLIISCSHPHDDHAAGLREIIESDPNITRFKRITFVDSGYPVAQSLCTLFRTCHPDFPAERFGYSSAKGRNAFASLWHEGSALKVSNFEYEPRLGAAEHGNAIIHHIIVEKNGQRTFVVDFDDADDTLLKKWAEWARLDPVNRRPNVVLAPHHSSDLSDITPLLDERIRPDACIITANPRNRFTHPGPQNTLKWVQSLGAEHVLITGVHENIVVNESGVVTRSTRETTERVLDTVLLPERLTLERHAAQMDEIAAERQLSASERNRAEGLQRRQAALSTLISLYRGRNGRDYPGGYSASPPFTLPLPPGPTPSSGSVGGFEEIRREASSRKSTAPAPPGGGRAAMFSQALQTFPDWGGIMLGNGCDPRSSKVRKATFDVTNDEAVIDIILEQGGKTVTCRFEEMTRGELWSAYNFVKPNSDLRAKFHVDETDNGVVGKSGDLNDGKGWTFGIHPAIAGTLLALDAMRLDMFISAEGNNLTGIRIPDFETYQWYDERAVLTAEDGLVRIKAVSEPHDLLLRVRLWTNALPSWAGPGKTMEEALPAELERRIVSRLGSLEKLDDLSESERTKLGEQIALQLRQELEAAGGANMPFDAAQLVTELDSRFNAFRRLERFARVVAVLHWIGDTSKDGLPPLPDTLVPKRFEIPPRLQFSEVKF